jgi:hypothetical protein
VARFQSATEIDGHADAALGGDEAVSCKQIKTSLLAMEQPNTPPAALLEHLAACPACRNWQRRLVLLEQAMASLPVPTSAARVAFLQRFLKATEGRPETAAPTAQSATWLQKRGVPAGSWSTLNRLGPRARRWLTAAAAAAVVLVVVGWWILESSLDRTAPMAQKAPAIPDAFVAGLLNCDLRLAEAETPSQRLAALADIADGLQDEGRALAPAARGDELLVLVGLYEEVIRRGLIEGARGLPVATRGETLMPIVERLDRAARAVDGAAATKAGASTDPLRRIAAAAREGGKNLHALIQEQHR